ncbi:ATP-binding protein, partial [bacterium]|nr:ATP-binding protein [bacterium]
QGVLILDELLEFSQEAQSVLREPMESGFYTMARAGRRQQFPCRAMVLATSNLCPCGEYTPSSSKICRCSSLQLRRYVQKLSGPFVDRFSIFCFSNYWRKSDSQEKMSSENILGEIEKSIAFRKSRGQKNVSEELSIEEIESAFENEKVKKLLPYFKSKRREMSCLRVARTIADLEFSEKIKIEHIEKSLHYTFFPFEEIKKIF